MDRWTGEEADLFGGVVADLGEAEAGGKGTLGLHDGGVAGGGPLFDLGRHLARKQGGKPAAVIRRRALLFAGAYFAHPAWQGSLLFADDSEQSRLHAWYHDLDSRETAHLRQELECVAAWWHTGERFFHTWKMRHADSFALPVAGAA